MSSGSTEYRDKSPIPSALSPTPRVLGASTLRDSSDERRDARGFVITGGSNDVDNPMFGDDNENENDNDSAYTATIKSTILASVFKSDTITSLKPKFSSISGVTSARQMPQLCARHKVAPLVLPPSPPTLAASTHIPNLGGLVRNINNLGGGHNRGNVRSAVDVDSSNCSGDPPDSLQGSVPAWPSGSVSRRVKKLSWDDDDAESEDNGRRNNNNNNTDGDKVSNTFFFQFIYVQMILCFYFLGSRYY